MKTMVCIQCGKKLEPEVHWYSDVLQVFWYCEDCKRGWVRDVYFTGTGTPLLFSDANLGLGQAIGDLLEEQGFAMVEKLPLEGCPPTDEVVRQWAEGRGYGDFPKEGL